MDDCGGSRCEGLIPTVKKKRSQRRRRIVSSTFPEFLHHSPLTSLSDNVGRFSSDKYADDANAGGRSQNLNYSISRDYSSIKKKEDGGSTATYNNARGGDDTNPRHGTSLRQSGNAGEGVANDSKMKLKVGEVRGAIQTKKSSYGSSSLFSSESVRPSDASEPRQNLTPQDNSSVHGPPADKKSGSNKISCEDFLAGTFGSSKSDLEKVPRRNVFEKQGDTPHQNRKSQRVPRRLILDELDEDEYADDANVGGRIYNLNYSISRDSSANRFKGDYSSIKKKEDGGSTATYSNARGGDDMNPGHGTSLRQSGNAGEGVANDSKMKLKVGEVRGTIQTKKSSYGSSSLFSSEIARPSDASEPRQNLTPQDNSSVHGPPADKKSGSNKISCKDFLGGTFGSSKSDLEKVPRKNVFEKHGDKPHQNRKSQRVPRRLILDELDEDEYADDANVGGRIYNLNYSISRDSSANRFKGDYSSIKKKEDGGSTATYSNARGGDDMNPGHGTSLRQSGNAGEGVANDKKMKLKVGEVRGDIQTKKSSYGSSSLFSSESARPSDASEPRQNLTPQDNSSVHGPPADKKSGSNKISCEDFLGGTFGSSKSDLEKVPRRNVFEKQGDKPHQNRKSQRVPRRLVLDEFDEDEYADDANVGGRIYNLNYSISRDSSANRFKGDYSSIKKKEGGGSTATYSNARGGDDMNPRHGTYLRQSGNAGEGVANDSKMKLKVGEVRRAIQIKNNSYGSSSSLVSSKSARPSDASEPRQNLAPQDNSSVHGPPADKKSGSTRISCEDFLGGTFGSSKSDLEKVPRRNVFETQGDKPHQNRKSQRVPRRLVLDEFDEDEYADDANVGGRIYNLNYSISRDSSANRFKGNYSSIKKKEDGGSTATYSNARGGDDMNPRHGTYLRQSGNAGEGVANDSKMKLKVGEVRGTIQTKNSSYGSSSLFSSESARHSDASEPRQNLTPQDNSSVHGPPTNEKSVSNRISCEDFRGGTFGASKSDLEKVPRRNVFEKQGDKPHQNRKSQRVPRRLVLDELDEDEYVDDANVGGRIYDLNNSISRDSSANRFKGDYSSIKKKEDGGSTVTYSNARGGDDMNPGHGTSLRQSGNAGEGVANDSKMKLKVGEVRRAIQIKNNSYGSSSSLVSSKSARPSDASEPRQNLAPQDNPSEHGPPADKKSGSKGISCEDFPEGTFGASKSDLEKMPMRNVFEKHGDKPHQNRKRQRVPRRLVLDGLDDNDEIHYLVKLNTSKVAGYKDLGEESTKTSGVLKVDKYDLENIGRSGKEVKRISHRGSEEELLSDGEAKWTKKEKQMKESSETPVETKSEINLTARQRALLSRRDSSATSVNQVEFPNGLPPAPPRKQKEKLSEVEQQLKKAEAARKRRIQYEKTARETEAEAIRKILGHDRKKREEETKKKQEELAQKRVAKELASNTIRTVIGPAGTTVTFSHDIGLPSIFDSKPCSYPPPREKCAGPSCVNPYKYRDSKSNLPLCSLKCYKAIHEKMQDEKPC